MPPNRPRLEKPSSSPQLSAPSPGWLEGYAAVFDNVDSAGEVVRRGAFAKTLRERLPAGKIALMIRHARDGGDALEVVGKVVAAREDDIGLWVRAEFGSDPTSQAARSKVVEKLVRGLSIGYVPIAGRNIVLDNRTVFELTEIKLLEVTLTAFPANDLAGVTAAKSQPSYSTASKPPRLAAIKPPPEASPQVRKPAPTDWSLLIARRRLALSRLALGD